MHIVIVGTGISGLTTYYFLHRFLSPLIPDLTIDAYESYKSPSVGIGGTLGLAPNGLYIIMLISPEAHARVVESGFPCGRFEFRNSRGRVLGLFPSGMPSRYLDTGGMVMQTRSVIYWEILDILQKEGARIHYGESAETVIPKEDGVEIKFKDGETVMADLVIGCDGIKSVVRRTTNPGVEAAWEYAPSFRPMHIDI